MRWERSESLQRQESIVRNIERVYDQSKFKEREREREQERERDRGEERARESVSNVYAPSRLK